MSLQFRVRISPAIVTYLLILAFLFHTSPALAKQYSCDGNKSVKIQASNDKMVGYVCTAADRTIDFLGQFNLTPQRNINIKITDWPVSHRGYMAYGSYYRQSDQIEIMSLPAILKYSDAPEMYKMPFDEEHYMGAVAHEITHAVFNHNAPPIEDKWNNAAQEYLAHATQLGVLPPEMREQIIKSERSGAWITGDEVSVTYMGFNPTGFAVKSYLHLTRLDDPAKFVQILLNHKWLYVSVP